MTQWGVDHTKVGVLGGKGHWAPSGKLAIMGLEGPVLQNRLRKRSPGCRGGRIVEDFGKDMSTLFLKWVSLPPPPNKTPLYSTWSSAQCYVAAWMGGSLGGDWIHVYV